MFIHPYYLIMTYSTEINNNTYPGFCKNLKFSPKLYIFNKKITAPENVSLYILPVQSPYKYLLLNYLIICLLSYEDQTFQSVESSIFRFQSKGY